MHAEAWLRKQKSSKNLKLGLLWAEELGVCEKRNSKGALKAEWLTRGLEQVGRHWARQKVVWGHTLKTAKTNWQSGEEWRAEQSIQQGLAELCISGVQLEKRASRPDDIQETHTHTHTHRWHVGLQNRMKHQGRGNKSKQGKTQHCQVLLGTYERQDSKKYLNVYIQILCAYVTEHEPEKKENTLVLLNLRPKCAEKFCSNEVFFR